MLLSRRHSSTPSTTTHQARLNGAHQNSQQQNGNDLIMMMWRQKSRSSPVSSLPNEVWISIFEHLDTQALIVSAQVCRTWASLADTKGLWSRERVRPQLVKVLGTPITERLLNVYKAEHCRPKDLYLQAVNQVKDEMISTITQLQFFFRYTWSHKFFKAEAIINRLLVMEEQIRLTAASPTTHTAGSKVAHCLGSPSPLHHPRISGLEQRRSSVPAISTAFLFSPGAAPPRSGLPAHLMKPMIPKVFWSAHSLLSHLRVMLEASDKLFDDSPPTMAMDLNAPDAVPNTSPRIIEAIDGMVRDIKSIGTFDRSVTVESWLSVFQLLAHQLPARTNCCVPYHLAEVIMRCCAEEWIKIDDFLQVVNDKHRLVETRVCNRHQDHVARFVSRGRPNATAASTPASASSSPVVAAKPSRRGSVIGLLNSLTSSLGGSSSKVGSPRTPLLQPPQCDHCHNRRAVGFVPICRGDDTGASTGLGSSGLNLSGSIMSLSGGLVEDADRFVVFYFCSQCRESGVCSNCGQKLFAWESSLRPSNPGDCMECRCGHRLVPRAHMASFSQRFEPDNHHGPGPVEPMEGAMETEQDSPPAQTEEEYLDAIRKAYQEDVERRNSVPVVLPESLADDDDLMYESDHGEDDEDDDCEVDEEEEDGEEDYESDGSDG
eukprot:TRINITY_DN7094_c0_g1_i5.p1 TRINITY_DN7094_c0_g1~~TRINITY_DN7094_c0_g1_i5.p1  ORF type:complete len:659 (-),score=172.86 TRINITY_DN7094_c0_g1_i5:73-2049(-)